MSPLHTPKPYNTWTSKYVSNSAHDNCWKLFATFFGPWNLDVLRVFYPLMCISPLDHGSLEYTLQSTGPRDLRCCLRYWLGVPLHSSPYPINIVGGFYALTVTKLFTDVVAYCLANCVVIETHTLLVCQICQFLITEL